MGFLGGYILAEGFFRIWFCPHSIIPSNLKSGVPPPGPLRLHSIIPKSFIFCLLGGGGKPRELKKHKLNKIKGKCKKKNYFVMTCRYTQPPHHHRRSTDEPQAGSLVPGSHGVRCNTFWHIQDGGSISWVQSVWRATTTSSRYDNRHFNPCSQLPYFSFQNITCSILFFFSIRTGVFELVAPIISKNVKWSEGS